MCGLFLSHSVIFAAVYDFLQNVTYNVSWNVLPKYCYSILHANTYMYIAMINTCIRSAPSPNSGVYWYFGDIFYPIVLIRCAPEFIQICYHLKFGYDLASI